MIHTRKAVVVSGRCGAGSSRPCSGAHRGAMLGAGMEDEDEDEGRRLVAYADELSAAGRYEAAIASYEQAIARAPRALAGYRFVIGELLFELQRYGEAASAFDSVVREMPRHAQAWEALGRTYTMLGAPDRAVQALENAIALAPAWGDPYYHAALAYEDLEDRERADDRKRRAIAIDARFALAED